MSESPLGDQTQAEDLDEDLPELSEEPDNDPAEEVDEPDADDQDPAGTEYPDEDKHPEEE